LEQVLKVRRSPDIIEEVQVHLWELDLKVLRMIFERLSKLRRRRRESERQAEQKRCTNANVPRPFQDESLTSSQVKPIP
jgi:hypothetical protein